MADHLVFQVFANLDSIQAAYGQAALWAYPCLRSTCVLGQQEQRDHIDRFVLKVPTTTTTTKPLSPKQVGVG